MPGFVRRRPALSAVVICIVLWLMPTLPPVRVALSRPLIVASDNPHVDAAYVLAAGAASIERLAAAADLYHMGQVPRIILARDGHTSRFNFVAKASWTSSQWASGYLTFYGVPETAITLVDVDLNAGLGTLNEARTVARLLPKDVRSLVLVTSPVHTRRSLLAFRRSLPSDISLAAYPACSAAESVEFNDPLWLEYLKLVIYWVIA
jgi:uncharacterized SAM-binding protein YcdF (DUF218 family)